jgi:hypothetical protein
MKRPIYKYDFTIESKDGKSYRECTASFHAYPWIKATWDEPGEPAWIEWIDVITRGPTGETYFTYFDYDAFLIWVRKFTSNPEWTLKQFDNEALQVADDYEGGKREEAQERKAEECRERVLEETTWGNN